jgi:hypothetical protein
MPTYVVKVNRWESRGPWWQWRRRVHGLELEIDGRGTTQTYGTRDLDAARMMVLEYLAAVDESVPSDATICWVETGA